MTQRFLRCEVCGNIVAVVEDSGVPIVCCGQNMSEIKANTTDGAVEKHVPVYKIEDGIVHVKVGSEPHPMTDMHHIVFIAIETNKGMQIKFVWDEEKGKSCDEQCKAECCFCLSKGEELVAVYEYCNLHGVFMCEAKR